MKKIVSAAIKIQDKRQQKEIILPCHRHWNIFYILEELGYKPSDYSVLEQGFLDNDWNFVNRLEAREIAFSANQIDDSIHGELFSEDLW